MRPRKPWYRADRDCWYVQHNGKQVWLAKGKKNKAEAQAAFHKLMLLEGDGPIRSRSSRSPLFVTCFSTTRWLTTAHRATRATNTSCRSSAPPMGGSTSPT